MKTVVRLILTCFTAQNWLVFAGAAVVLTLLFSAALNISFTLQGFGFFAFVTLFFGSMYMPSMFSRLARSRTIDLLPHGRLKLLACSLATVAMVSVPIPFIVISAMKSAGGYGADDINYFGTGTSILAQLQAPFFWHVFALSALGYTWIYAVIWSAAGIRTHRISASLQTPLYSNSASLLTLLLIFAAPPFLRSYGKTIVSASIPTLFALIAAVWCLFAFCFLVLPRLRITNTVQSKADSLLRRFRSRNINTSGKELRLVLGLWHPWSYIVVICVMGLLLLSSTRANNSWLFYLTVLGTIAGGLPANVAASARGLWLRRPCSREQLFLDVEKLFWRFVGLRMALLIAWGVILGVHAGFSWPLIAWGSLHLVAAATASIYLGLMQTRKHPWLDSIAAVITFSFAVLGAIAASGDLIGIPLATSLLVAITFAHRLVAKRRWQELDWMQCKAIKIA
jgi:hypothetical protein